VTAKRRVCQRDITPLRGELLRRDATSPYSCPFCHATTLPEDRPLHVTINVTKRRVRRISEHALKAKFAESAFPALR
jgi:hypothetical protein